VAGREVEEDEKRYSCRRSDKVAGMHGVNL